MAGEDRGGETHLATNETAPWFSAYPDSIPHAIEPRGTLADLFSTAIAQFDSRPAFKSFGSVLSYRALGQAADKVTAWLQAQGFVKGDRIAIMMPNVLAFPAVMIGAIRGGYTVVNVNPLYTAIELTHQLQDAGARAMFVLENFAHTVEMARPDLGLDAVVVVAPGDLMGWKGHLVNAVSRHMKRAVPPFALPGHHRLSAIMAAPAGRVSPVAIDGADIAFLQYTGGTTGTPKGAMLTHRNIVANVAQIRAWVGAWVPDGLEGQVMVTALPLYHIFSLTACCISRFVCGACSLLIANPRDIAGLVKTLQKERFTMLCGVNTLFNAILNHPGAKEIDFSRLAFCVSGGMATQAAVAERWKDLTGQPIIEGYGLSETSPVVSVNRLDIEAFTGTIGYPLPSTKVVIRAPGASDDLPIGSVGELCVRGPQVMAGYWRQPDATAAVMTADGFFRTGDLAVMEADGALRIVDRIKDMVIVSGFNVYPTEVEDVLVRHPKVLEAAVIGLPDAQSGEMVAAYIVRRDASLTDEEIRTFARQSLTPYKMPRQIIFCDSLPKSNVGKVLRRVLRETVLDGHPSASST
ncbi:MULTISPECIES: AMP-binding protein [unclassified Chelatococcus]|uniref:AMP-binding protein n=1 Tax=unclassified Chelatococcus TaxID=2638111 RepID=UPI001BD08E29|nr:MULTISPECIES: AMP-binding protein [unclassified Chelatococcus]CAH1665299.1 Long-chain-fatty-acid--CoA ligase [Hyphomicrobiales bacterium]MBS7737699.1 AMP-binding protein [Chelatococcus sp. HY11]MBX3544167.1 AMP-binding protein [Chelatococcus sp.]MCO5079511.1 AMP-binding protein [Chelatococcus sp.]CAH1681418.1 Long-chain-fatty-acid--CoA ligase [Hyphomicrobiales bacterium]